MNKQTIAENINCKNNLTRTIAVDRELNLKVGDIYDNRGNVESWSGSNSDMNFLCELENEITYVFYCKNVPCHHVNYENEQECEILNCGNCESEDECLVLPSTKMKIVDIGSMDDFKEMGYIPVDLELIEDNK